jgi:RNA polymerase sigma-70 factor (ECF subfamily)
MEDSLRARIRAGDADAFAELFDDTSPAVHGMALRATGDWAQAEDVVSLTFLEIWRLRQTVRREDAPLRPFVLGVGLNVLRNQSRSARRHRAALARLPACEHLPDFADEVVERIADAEQVSAARTALDALNRAERDVVLLCGWSELNSAAAAEILGVAPGTVRSRLSRARARLRASVGA